MKRRETDIFSFNKKKNSYFKRCSFIVPILSVLTLATSCISDSGKSSNRVRGGATGVNNDPSTVAPGFGRILEDNPIILSGNPNLTPDANLALYLTSRTEYITDRQFLEGECFSLPTICFEVKKDEPSNKFQSPSTKWAYPTNSSEFLQVNTFGHMKRMIDRYNDNLRDIFFNKTFSASSPATLNYRTAIPGTLYTNLAHWKSTPLVALADSRVKDNAFFSPATFTISLGEDSVFTNLKFSQDSTVVYHEIAHAFNMVKMNYRNQAASVTIKTDLGYLFYDEAGAINEGIADYYSYLMNGRTHFGEWALGRFIRQSRPLKESESLHAPGISATKEGRLSYPAFLSYDPNRPTGSFEDIHYAGQIISHYLVALTEMFKTECSMSHREATDSVQYLMMETLAELGDLTSRGSDHNATGQVNLNNNLNLAISSLNSLEWIRTAKPLSYRSFAQTIAKNQLKIFGDPIIPRCKGRVLEQDTIERLLDDYGLLVFRTYNNNRNSIAGEGNIATSVSNRVKSELVSKNVLKLDPRDGRAQAFVFDDRQDMVQALESLTSSGQITESLSNQIESDLPFNNGNARISPGEFVGVALNLYNDSNSAVAGVEILASDWDHTKGGKMCNNLGDGFPLESEGAADLSVGEGAPGACDYTTRDNGREAQEEIAPVCFIQDITGDTTEWVNQQVYRTRIAGIEPNDCLGGDQKQKSCFIRFLKGVDRATISKLNPKKTYSETITGSSGTAEFNISNILFMEVNKKTPPGTTFNCRLRVRFTNCDDCWHDPANNNDDYLDYEFAGHRPFKILNFRFTVID